MTRLYLAGAAILATAALAAATPSAAYNPIPGVDIIVQKEGCKPPCPPVPLSGLRADGVFGGQLTLARGTYTVRTACSPGVRCPAHRLTTLMVNGRTVIPDARGGVRIAVGDVNGDGRAELTTFRGTITLIRRDR